MSENNEKQNPEESFKNKCQKHIACSYRQRCGSDVMETHFNKKLVKIKEDSENFKSSTNCWIYDNDYIENDIKVRNHCHIA